MEALLAQSDRMLVNNHYAAPSLREMAWNLRELLEDFSARINEREKTLHEAADFYKTAEKVCGTCILGSEKICGTCILGSEKVCGTCILGSHTEIPRMPFGFPSSHVS